MISLTDKKATVHTHMYIYAGKSERRERRGDKKNLRAVKRETLGVVSVQNLSGLIDLPTANQRTLFVFLIINGSRKRERRKSVENPLKYFFPLPKF